jgi:hypothetical protein
VLIKGSIPIPRPRSHHHHSEIGVGRGERKNYGQAPNTATTESPVVAPLKASVVVEYATGTILIGVCVDVAYVFMQPTVSDEVAVFEVVTTIPFAPPLNVASPVNVEAPVVVTVFENTIGFVNVVEFRAPNIFAPPRLERTKKTMIASER